jgi:hypothetical protein
MPIRRTTLLLLHVPLLLCAGALAGQGPRSPADAVLYEIAETLLGGAEAADGIWGTAWFTGEFAILTGDGRALVVTAEPFASALEPPVVPRRAERSSHWMYLLPSGHPEVPEAHGQRRIGGRSLLAWPLADSIFSIREPVLASVVVLYHELFHLNQVRPGQWSFGSWREYPPRAIVSSARFQEIAEREREILAQAITTTSREELDPLIADYLRTRADRVRLLPADSRGYEVDYERIEGTAHWVAYSAGLLAVRGHTDELVAIARQDLLSTPLFDGSQPDLGSYRGWHIYATGVAICILLDRLDPSGSWREPLRRGTGLAELLSRAAGQRR